MADHEAVYPQRPVLHLNVGVSGHRLAKMPEPDHARVAALFGKVFSSIDRACLAHIAKYPASYADQPPCIRLLDGLAEGADQIALSVKPEGWESVAILPFPRANYRQDFAPAFTGNGADLRTIFDETIESVDGLVELPLAGGLRGTARSGEGDLLSYAQLGAFLVEQIDVLVAVWDGNPPAGPGGTGDVVARALEQGVTVIWIASDREQQPWLIKSLADTQRDASLADATTGPIAEAIANILSLPADHREIDGAAAESRHAAANERLQDFLAEHPKTHCRWVAYDCLKRLSRFWTWRMKIDHRNLAAVSEEWSEFLALAPVSTDLSPKIRDVLMPRFTAADALAAHFSHKYRSAYVLAYALAVAAVAIALVGTLPLGPHEMSEALLFKAGLVFVELVLVASVIVIVAVGRQQRWHDRWLDYRALAEMLRHLRFLSLLGEYGNLGRPIEELQAGAAWVTWYVRATARELGLPTAVLDASYQRAVLHATLSTELSEQIAYNRANAAELKALHNRLHVLGDLCFIGTAAMLLFFLVAILGEWLFPSLSAGWRAVAVGFGFGAGWQNLVDVLYALKPWATAIAAFLPALGAAFAGIKFTGDFEGFAERSAQTASALHLLEARYLEAIERLDLKMTGDALDATARVMMKDVGVWYSLYSRKHLSLPA